MSIEITSNPKPPAERINLPRVGHCVHELCGNLICLIGADRYSVGAPPIHIEAARYYHHRLGQQLDETDTSERTLYDRAGAAIADADSPYWAPGGRQVMPPTKSAAAAYIRALTYMQELARLQNTRQDCTSIQDVIDWAQDKYFPSHAKLEVLSVDLNNKSITVTGQSGKRPVVFTYWTADTFTDALRSLGLGEETR